MTAAHFRADYEFFVGSAALDVERTGQFAGGRMREKQEPAGARTEGLSQDADQTPEQVVQIHCFGFGVVEAVNGNIRTLINRGRGYKNLTYLLLKAKRMAVTNVEFVAIHRAKQAA